MKRNRKVVVRKNSTSDELVVEPKSKKTNRPTPGSEIWASRLYKINL